MWHRYVLLAMGLSPPALLSPRNEPSAGLANASLAHAAGAEAAPGGSGASHRGVYLWPRREHWRYRRAPNEPKPGPAYVRYVGHGGIADAGGARSPRSMRDTTGTGTGS